MSYRAVILDCDDTILATAKKRWPGLIDTARSFGLEVRESTIRAAWGKPFKDLVKTIAPNVQFDAFLETYRVTMRRFKPEPTPGAVEFVKTLARLGVWMEIVTSSSSSLVVQDLDELDLTQYFDRIFGYEETEYAKPDPRVLALPLARLRELGCQSGEVAYIGDSTTDLQVALGNDLDFFAVITGLHGEQEFLYAGLEKDNIFSTFIELLQFSKHSSGHNTPPWN